MKITNFSSSHSHFFTSKFSNQAQFFICFVELDPRQSHPWSSWKLHLHCQAFVLPCMGMNSSVPFCLWLGHGCNNPWYCSLLSRAVIMASSPYCFKGLFLLLRPHFGTKKVGVGSRLEGGKDPCMEVEEVGFVSVSVYYHNLCFNVPIW